MEKVEQSKNQQPGQTQIPIGSLFEKIGELTWINGQLIKQIQELQQMNTALEKELTELKAKKEK